MLNLFRRDQGLHLVSSINFRYCFVKDKVFRGLSEDGKKASGLKKTFYSASDAEAR